MASMSTGSRNFRRPDEDLHLMNRTASVPISASPPIPTAMTDEKPDQGNQCLKITVSETNVLRHHQADDTRPNEDTTKRVIRQGTPVAPDTKIDTSDPHGSRTVGATAATTTTAAAMLHDLEIVKSAATAAAGTTATAAITVPLVNMIAEACTEEIRMAVASDAADSLFRISNYIPPRRGDSDPGSATTKKPNRRHRCSTASPELMGLDLRDSTADLDTGTKRRAERRAARRGLPELGRLMLRNTPTDQSFPRYNFTADLTPGEADVSTTVADVNTTTRRLGEKSNQELGTNPQRVLKITTSLGYLEHRADLDQWNEGQWNQIGCYAKPFTEADRKMSFFEGALETAFVATEHFQTMLKGNELRIYTNCAPLVGAMSNLAYRPSEDYGGMTDLMRRKLEYIAQYTMIIQYRIQCCDMCREEDSDDEKWPPPDQLDNYPTNM